MKFVKIAFGGLVALFLLGPQLVILPLAFTDSQLLAYPVQRFSFRWFEELWTSSAWRLALKNSLFVGLATAALATVLGTLAAVGMRHMRGLFSDTLRVVFLLPMVVPTVVLGVGMQLVYSPLGLGNSYTGLIFGHTVIAVPFVLVNVLAALQGIEPSVERAASSLGASRARVLRYVTLPMALPGVVTGALFSFATSLDEVVLTLFLAGSQQRTISREMFAQIRDRITPAIVSASFVFIVATICIAILGFWLKKRAQSQGAVA